MDGLPSSTLKAQFLDLLESDESSFKVLAKVFRIDITQYATVCDLVANYEERFGELLLGNWKDILKRLGYLEYFEQHVDADQFIADVTDIKDLDDKSSLATCTMQLPRNERVGKYVSTPSGTLPDELNMSAMSKRPDERLPCPIRIPKNGQNGACLHQTKDLGVKKETTVDNVATCDIDHNSALEAATESAFFSAEETNKMSSNSKSLSRDVENATGQFENAAVAGTPASSLQADSQADSKQQSHETPPRPTSPEAHAPHSSHDSLVTGQRRSCQINAAVAGTHCSENEEQGHRETGNPAEQDDDSETHGLLTELEEALESSQLNVSFLAGELRKKDSFCASLRTYIHLLNQELEVSRGQCGQLQETVEELTRHLGQSAVLEAESQELIRMIQEMYVWKEQQCNRLEEMYAGKEQQCNRLVEELQSAVAMQEFLQYREENLRREHERLRLDCERRLEERLVEVRRAFDNAETDKVRTLKQKLAREKSKRKEIEEKSKALLKETRRLRALPRQMKPNEEGSVTFGCSYEDDVSSHTASSEVKGDEYPGSSNHNQQSDSDDSSEDELFEDARDEFYFP